MSKPIRRARLAALACLLISASAVHAELDPAAVRIDLPASVPWKAGPNGGSESATLVGDPTKPGLYVVLVKWKPGNTSRPHFHPNDRYIRVLSGTWWIGTGQRYDPASMVPAPAGSFVTHVGGQVHYDGAKDEETVLQIVGIGPATATGAELR
ncbi:cupin domain-containing protein [Derxia lacustris]|uniref:cupin domain-containing protein n=1 Tax=Derxia lacustris TaxID=764842 RepID=UPI000A16D221|nr:cupin domain-containing protein [Derxia lacustris]